MSEQTSRHVVVIGGGITGLSAAYFLCKEARQFDAPLEITLLEAAQQPGGVITTRRRNDFLLEGGPDSFITTKPWAARLCEELGLGDQLIRTQSTQHGSFILQDNALHPMPEGFALFAPTAFWPFVRTPLFSWRGKLRMAMDLILPRGSNNGAEDDESLEAFVVRRMGREALERMAQPLVAGIYTGDARKLSLRATMPQMLEMEQRDRSIIRAMWKNRRALRRRGVDTKKDAGARYSLFLSLRDGMGTLTERLTKELPAGCVRTGAEVLSVVQRDDSPRWEIHVNGREPMRADALCIALPASRAAEVLTSLDGELASQLGGISYASSAIVNFAFKRTDFKHPLNGMGFVVPLAEGKSLIACSFSSVKFAGRAPDDMALLRAFVGGAVQPERYALSDEEMIQAVLADLRPILGLEAEPVFVEVNRHPSAMAQYHLGHLDRVASIESLSQGHPGLALAGNGYRGIGIPDCIHGAELAVQRLIEEIRAL